MPDANSVAEIVVLTVKSAVASAVAPLLERLAVAESELARVGRTDHAMAALRDRIVAMETKSAMGTTIEAPSPDLVSLEKRLEALEANPAASLIEQTIYQRLTALEGRAQPDPIVHEKEMSALRERLAVVETRQPIPGPPGTPGKDGANGLDGKDGKDGLNGKDGADGLGWDDTSIEHDGERTFSVKLHRGDRFKGGGIFTVPVDIYRGVYVEGRSYDRGDGVTYGGSEWHCNETTSAKPGDGSKAWTLKVKRGRDGKDGRDAATLPVVSVGR